MTDSGQHPGPLARRVVLKFGGSSVSSVQGWETIAGLVRRKIEDGERILVVHSALVGVTDGLDLLPEEAAQNRHEPLLEGLVERHYRLCRDLGLEGAVLLEPEISQLRKHAEGIALTQEVTPRIQARILAFGERLSTRIGAAFLASRKIAVVWLPATELLQAEDTGRQSGAAVWLSAECDAELDSPLRERLDDLAGIGLTQGFTARNARGETVVLGRGGSDTSAAYLAGKWGADRLEVWSDVPGMFSADPRVVPSARLLRRLDYSEAQEIATTGSQVLHPRAIRALRDRRIPIHLKSTRDPSAPNTVIERTEPEGRAQVKAISWKRRVVLVSMETLGMWQEVGFLARTFEVFRDVGLSIDLVSTSETNVTVSLDGKATLLDEETIARLTQRLSTFCGVRVIRPCAAVSLVGSRIRGMLHRMGPALEAFEEHRVHLVTQAANDLNLTVVVDEDQAEELVQRLHALLIPEALDTGAPVFGPSFSSLSGPEV
ncbi:MAG: aspartate kinase [Gemmatimonadota bacterium]